jgi:hypothetical protein
MSQCGWSPVSPVVGAAVCCLPPGRRWPSQRGSGDRVSAGAQGPGAGRSKLSVMGTVSYRVDSGRVCPTCGSTDLEGQP